MYSQQTEREKRVHHFFDSIDLLFDLRKRMALDFINLHAQNSMFIPIFPNIKVFLLR